MIDLTENLHWGSFFQEAKQKDVPDCVQKPSVWEPGRASLNTECELEIKCTNQSLEDHSPEGFVQQILNRTETAESRTTSEPQGCVQHLESSCVVVIVR